MGMNPAVLLFADGRIYFVGLILSYAGLSLALHVKSGLWRKVLHILGITGLLFVMLSSTPAIWMALFVFILSLLFNFVAVWKPVFARAATLVLSLTILLLILLELPYHRMPTIEVSADSRVYVLGDSISAGMGAGETPWPEVLDSLLPIPVINFAQPGAVTTDGLRQAERIGDGPAVVLVMLGGNDVLGTTTVSGFGTALDTLLLSLFEAEHSVYLLQTPTLPFQSGFTNVQRLWAAKYGVTLLPKRLLTRTLGQPDATLDGLHLSDTGHRHLAQQFAEHIRIRGQ